LFLVTERRYSFCRRLFLRIHKPKPQTNTRGATPIITATGWFIKGFGGIAKSLQSIKPRKIIENQKKTVRVILGFAVGVVMLEVHLWRHSFQNPFAQIIQNRTHPAKAEVSKRDTRKTKHPIIGSVRHGASPLGWN